VSVFAFLLSTCFIRCLLGHDQANSLICARILLQQQQLQPVADVRVHLKKKKLIKYFYYPEWHVWIPSHSIYHHVTIESNCMWLYLCLYPLTHTF